MAIASQPSGTAIAPQQQQQQIIVPRTGCGEDCFNRSCHTTCDPRVCPCGLSCSNRPFHLLTFPRTKTILTENRGWGLFLAEPVRAGTFIVEYTGEIIDDKTCEERLWADKKRGEDNFYLMEVRGNQITRRAGHKGNLSRFINSSCQPNCETQKWQDGSTGETRVGIFAIQDIPQGAELMYDYNFAHFGGEGTTSFSCKCGHPLCRGTLDANPERTRNYNRRVEIQWANKGFYAGTVLSYHNKTEKHQVLYDTGEQEYVRLEGEDAAAGIAGSRRRPGPSRARRLLTGPPGIRRQRGANKRRRYSGEGRQGWSRRRQGWCQGRSAEEEEEEGGQAQRKPGLADQLSDASLKADVKA